MTKKEKKSKSVAWGAGLMAIGTLFSRFLGLIRDMLIAYGFSVAMTDAWLVAFKIPNSLRRIFGEGALSAAFIPEMVQTKEKQGLEEAKKLAGGLYSLLSMVLLIVSIFGVLYPESFIPYFTDGRGFSEIPGKVENTIRFTRIMFFFLFFICNFAFFMAILNSFKEFFWPGFAPVLFNFSMILFALLPQSWVQVPGDLLSYAVLVGGALQMLVLLPVLKKKAFLPQFRDFRQKKVCRVLKNMFPSIISLGVLQMMTLVNVKFAAELENGTNSWLYYADRMLELPLSLISVSLGTALLPSLSEYWAQGRTKDMLKELSFALHLSMYLALPAGIGLFFMAEDFIALLFGRGHFTSHDIAQTAGILQVYSVSLILYSLVRVFNSVYYATKRFWFPVLGALTGLIVHIFCAPYWMALYGPQGLAISTAIGGAFNLLLTSSLVQWQIGNIFFKEHFKVFLKNCPSLLAISILLYSVKQQIDFSLLNGLRHTASILLILSVVFTYFGLGLLLKIPFCTEVFSKIKSRIK